jgi:ADP-ribose pyrophosphatase YjhB (NUDIX family)
MQPEPDARQATQIRPSVAAVVRDEQGQILLQRRSDNGRWGLPGGSVEIGESVAEAIRREVVEETGFRIEVGRLVGVYSDPALQVVRYPGGSVVHYISILFECRIVGGAPATSAETLEVGFFPPGALPESLLPMHRIRIEDALAKTPQAMIR